VLFEFLPVVKIRILIR